MKIYYAENTIYEVIQVACEWGFQDCAFVYNAFTYLSRMGKKTVGKKNIINDLKKAKFYIQKEIEITELRENHHISFFNSVKLKSMVSEKNKKRQNVKLIMAFWGYGAWFNYCSTNNAKFYEIHKDIIINFKKLNKYAYYGGLLSENQKNYLILLNKILNRINALLVLMK
jgi:hypothetical protein